MIYNSKSKNKKKQTEELVFETLSNIGMLLFDICASFSRLMDYKTNGNAHKFICIIALYKNLRFCEKILLIHDQY